MFEASSPQSTVLIKLLFAVLLAARCHGEDGSSWLPSGSRISPFSRGVDGSGSEMHQLFSKIDLTCELCKTLIREAKGLLETNGTQEEILDFVAEVCTNVTSSLLSPDVCNGAVQLMGPEVVYVLNTTTLDNDVICSLFLHEEHCSSTLPLWSVNIPGGKPEIDYPEVVEGPTSVKILHISDPHIDLHYAVGSPVECDRLLCCRDWETDEPPPSNVTTAGMWGAEDGPCDLPLRTFELLLQQAATHQPDMVYVTGDHPPHDGWMQTHDSNMAATVAVIEAVNAAFPNVPVFHSVGNHEAVPVNSFSVPSVYSSGWSMTWLYDQLAELWSSTGLTEEALNTVRRGGFYSHSPKQGLRIVAVNMNYCNTFNWWLLLENVDPTGQLMWLQQELLNAEQKGEKVHILDHISPGSRDCEAVWSHAINTIYTRFESTITGIFSGHHHCDQFRLLWDVDNNTRAVGVSYLAPSVSSGWRKSPAFRIFTVDGGYQNATWLPLDHKTYTLNLTVANQQDATPLFELAYSAKDAYGLSGLSPQDWASLGWSMATEDLLFEEYIRHYFNYWKDPSELQSCDLECRKDLLCEMFRGDSMDLEPCQRIMRQVDNATMSIN